MDLIRGLTPAFKDAITRPFFPVMLAFIDWPSAPAYIHTSSGNITWNGQTWVGVGRLGSAELPEEETAGISSERGSLSFIGVEPDLSGLIDDDIRGSDVVIYSGILSGGPGEPGGTSLLTTPVAVFNGTIDGLNIDVAAASNTIVAHEASIEITTGPSARTATTMVHTLEDQQRRFPNDTAGRLIIGAYARAQKLRWPEE